VLRWHHRSSKIVKPVRLPPGRLRLATSPDATGSSPTAKNIGIVVVAALAATTAGPFAKIAATGRRIGTRHRHRRALSTRITDNHDIALKSRRDVSVRSPAFGFDGYIITIG